MRRLIQPNVFETLLGLIIFSIVVLVIWTAFEVYRIKGNRFTSEDFVSWVTTDPHIADSTRAAIRERLDIPPPNVREGLAMLDSLHAELDSLRRRVQALE